MSDSTQDNPFDLSENDSRTLPELETDLMKEGVTPEQLQVFKEQLLSIHLSESNAQLMIGTSYKIMGAAFNYAAECGLGLDGMVVVKTFADKYHQWIAEHEAIVVDEMFGKEVRTRLTNATTEEIDILLAKARHAVSQLHDPKNAKRLYADILTKIIPHADLLSIEGIHLQLSGYLDRLARSTNPPTENEPGQPIFRNGLRIFGWLHLEESLLHTKNEIEVEEAMGGVFLMEKRKNTITQTKIIINKLLEAIRKRDIPSLDQLMKTHEAQNCLNRKGYDEIAPYLSEQLD